MDRGLAGRDGQLAPLDVVSPRLELFIQRGESFDERPGEFVQQLALISRFDSRSTSFKEFCAQVTLERLDLQRYGRLREAQSSRCFGNASHLHNRAKPLQLLQSVLLVSKYPHAFEYLFQQCS